MANIFVDLGKQLTEEQIKHAASTFNIPYSSLKAVIEVETKGRGFYTGTLIPIVRFENHVFGKYTKYQFNISHPQLSSTFFNGRFNVEGWKEFERFQKAYDLDKVAAIKATSWGLGQVMGFNYEAAGYDDLDLFVQMMFESEERQLFAMLEFIKTNKLDKFLIFGEWDKFAEGYNGKRFKENKYDVKLKDAAARYKK